ncbi:MAG TPA: hypothetical protein VJ327_09160 [Patescibacteria group bacterium]|nr:hypothetical protein [Patescibacteria group bacterium]
MPEKIRHLHIYLAIALALLGITSPVQAFPFSPSSCTGIPLQTTKPHFLNDSSLLLPDFYKDLYNHPHPYVTLYTIYQKTGKPYSPWMAEVEDGKSHSYTFRGQTLSVCFDRNIFHLTQSQPDLPHGVQTTSVTLGTPSAP